jgi:hypothetical protein
MSSPFLQPGYALAEIIKLSYPILQPAKPINKSGTKQAQLVHAPQD